MSVRDLLGEAIGHRGITAWEMMDGMPDGGLRELTWVTRRACDAEVHQAMQLGLGIVLMGVLVEPRWSEYGIFINMLVNATAVRRA